MTTDTREWYERPPFRPAAGEIIGAKRVKDACMAYCHGCNHTITKHHYWPFANTLWLHQHGSCPGGKIDLYGYRIDVQPERFR